jgi:hypothetical protein
MSDLLLIRRHDDGKATWGELHLLPPPFQLCYTLENTWRDNERSVSCIPAGAWPLTVRTEGGWHEKYRKRYAWHQGMIEVQTPNREFILFHAGNTHEDTRGCILPGIRLGKDSAGHHAVWSSGDAYRAIYRHLMKCANEGGKLHIISAPGAKDE